MFKLPLLFLLPASLVACKCVVSLGVCNAVAARDLVFIGTVERVEPAFLDPWNPARLSLLPTEEILRLAQEESPASLTRLKEIYTQLYPNMPDYFRKQFDAAQSVHALESVIDADDENSVVTVWTPSNDCGFAFQTGETYLVYTDQDEETNRIETSICTRTKRLSDAGSDLAYLYFRDGSEDNSTRLEGFVSSNVYQDASRSPIVSILRRRMSWFSCRAPIARVTRQQARMAAMCSMAWPRGTTP